MSSLIDRTLSRSIDHPIDLDRSIGSIDHPIDLDRLIGLIDHPIDHSALIRPIDSDRVRSIILDIYKNRLKLNYLVSCKFS
jgi:hypothetical protein